MFRSTMPTLPPASTFGKTDDKEILANYTTWAKTTIYIITLITFIMNVVKS